MDKIPISTNKFPEDINPEITNSINKYIKEAVELLEADTYNFINHQRIPEAPLYTFLKSFTKPQLQ